MSICIDCGSDAGDAGTQHCACENDQQIPGRTTELDFNDLNVDVTTGTFESDLTDSLDSKNSPDWDSE